MCGGRFTRAARRRRRESQWDLQPVCRLGAEKPQRRLHSLLIKINNFKAAAPPPCRTGGGMTAQADGRRGRKEGRKDGRKEGRKEGASSEWWWYKGVRRNRSCHRRSLRHRRLRLTFMLTICYLFVQTAAYALFPPLLLVGFARQTACVVQLEGDGKKKLQFLIALLYTKQGDKYFLGGMTPFWLADQWSQVLAQLQFADSTFLSILHGPTCKNNVLVHVHTVKKTLGKRHSLHNINGKKPWHAV